MLCDKYGIQDNDIYFQPSLHRHIHAQFQHPLTLVFFYLQYSHQLLDKRDFLNITIETGRLILLPISPARREEIFHELISEITKFMYPAPAKEISETDDFISHSLEGMAEGSNVQLVITAKGSGEFLGCAGLHHVDTKNPELGVWIKKSGHGNGYGKEAIMALKNWADQNLDYEYLLYPVADENIASRKIPESMGAEIAREYDDEGMAGNKYHCLEYHIYRKA